MTEFGRYHPAVLFFYFMSVLLICMFVSNPVLEGLALLGSVSFLFVVPGKMSARGVAGYVVLFLVISLMNPLFSHNGATPLFFMNGNAVTLEALLYGVLMGVTIVAVLLWCAVYSRVMNSEGFLYLFGKIIPKIALLLSMALRFIPVFLRQMKKVAATQKTMGMYSDEGYTGRIKGAMRVFLATVSWSVENSIETSMSMKARGYGVKGKRTSFSLFRFNLSDARMLALMIVLLCATLVGVASGEMSFSFYPRVSGINTSLCAWITYISFAVLTFLPTVVEIKTKIEWRYFLSRV